MNPQELPEALFAEVFRPDQVVVMEDENGCIHLLMYVGPSGDGGFVGLKHAVIDAEHAGIFARSGGEAPDVEEEELEMPESEDQVGPLPDRLLRAARAAAGALDQSTPQAVVLDESEIDQFVKSLIGG